MGHWDGKAKEITVMTEASMRPAVQYRYECHQYGGAEALGHTSRDHYNFVNRLKMKAIEGGDAQVVIDKLSQRAAHEDDFFIGLNWIAWVGCVMCWRDSMMKDDYELYEDLLFLIPLIVQIELGYVGVPNTRRGYASGIFIRMQLVIWTLKSDDTFSDAFKNCLRGCYDSVEFEASWDYMMKKYGLEGDKWFARLYQLKDKWSTALSKDFFSAGILSSQRSESTNNAIGFQASKTTSL
ncbi:uncharacterized protein LOC104896758 [Beta vulgaris subsp. vulgaris]|uniref:uncharacterized protein LOC104896758 n=1 Tax=Beta vulgaris subsp. vulgaris TaxID=3555 RepID=UPI002547B349|nr:uncharacterized protein LOC104896758 [Beta vulgaris subsp. vulgaris]